MSDLADSAVRYLDSHFDDFLESLKRLVRIPSVSAEGFPGEEVARSAAAVADEMRAAGLEHVEVLEVPGAHPYVYGDWLEAAGKPTLLLYAHHDVQPPGRPEHWKTPAFEPTVRADGRLYGRGAVDDKAGVVTHLGAIAAYLRTTGTLPVNVKLIVEGEEEIGSTHLEELLLRHRKQLTADVLVLTDTANVEEGIPSLTYRLRGLVAIDVEFVGLDHPLHSGMWGGPIPDPLQAACRALGSLTDVDGRIAVDGIYDEVREPTQDEREAVARLPFSEEKFRADAGLPASSWLVGERGYSPFERMWLRPSIAITALEAAPLATATNQLVPSLRCRVGVRIVPDMRPERTAKLVIDHLKRMIPWGVEVRAKVHSASTAWMTEPTGPAFDAARRALARGFGRETALIGAGGSIPFVGPFAHALGGAPALLVGLEDPRCNAHSENESLNVDDWQKAMRGAVYLYDELATSLARG